MIGILGTGRCLPEKVMTNEDWAGLVDTSDEWIVSRTGIRSRRFATNEAALDLTLSAARTALEKAGVRAEDLGLIVCATLSGDNICPSLSCELLKALGASCPAFDVNAACTGFLYALGAAQGMMGDKPALIVATELMTRLFDFTDRSTCVLFGDGSGAAVLGQASDGRGILYNKLMAYPDEKKSLLIPGINHKDGESGKLVPSYVQMDGGEVYKFATRVMAADISEALAAQNLTLDDVAYFVPHQANMRIIQTAGKLLGVPMERFFVNIDHVGNTSCASVAIALDELACSGRIKSGDIIVMSVFGGGFTSATTIIRW